MLHRADLQFEGLDVTSSDSSRFDVSTNWAEFPVDDTVTLKDVNGKITAEIE